MRRGGTLAAPSNKSSSAFRRRFLHSTAALGSDAGPSSSLSSLRASLAADVDEKEKDGAGIASASVGIVDGESEPPLSSSSPQPQPAPPPPPPPPPPSRQAREPDFTQLAALAASLAARAVPGRVDDVVGVDEATVALKLRVRPLSEVLRSEKKSSSSSAPSASANDNNASSSSSSSLETAWLWICWKPGAARACLGPQPPRGSPADGFASTSRLREELRGRVLSSVALRRRWERVLALAFSSRDDDDESDKGRAASGKGGGGGGERGLYGDEGDDPYAAVAEEQQQKKAAAGGGGVGSGSNDNSGLAAPDRLLFLEVMGRRSNMVLTDVFSGSASRAAAGFAPAKGGGAAEFALAAAEAAAVNDQARRQLLAKERQKQKRLAAAAAKGKAGGSTKRGKRGAANAAAAAAAEAEAEAEAAAAAAALEQGGGPTSFLPLPPGVKLPDPSKLPPLPQTVRIPSYYATSPAAAAAAASYPPSSGGEGASLGISGDAAAAFSSSSGGGGGDDASSLLPAAQGGGGALFSVPRLIPPAAAAKPGKILALGRGVPRSASQSRPLAVGGRYSPPPGLLTGSGGGRLEPGMSETREVWRSNVLGAAAALRAQRREYLERGAEMEAARAARAAAWRAARAAESSSSSPNNGDGESSGLEVQLEGEELPPAPPPPPAPTPAPAAIVVTPAAALVHAYGGVSPSLAQELCWAAGIRNNGGGSEGGSGVGGSSDTCSPADDVEEALSEADWGRLHSVWRNWLCAVADARFAPGTAHDGAPSVLGGGVLLEGTSGEFAAPAAHTVCNAKPQTNTYCETGSEGRAACFFC